VESAATIRTEGAANREWSAVTRTVLQGGPSGWFRRCRAIGEEGPLVLWSHFLLRDASSHTLMFIMYSLGSCAAQDHIVEGLESRITLQQKIEHHLITGTRRTERP
jgi:hypothetical protein